MWTLLKLILFIAFIGSPLQPCVSEEIPTAFQCRRGRCVECKAPVICRNAFNLYDYLVDCQIDGCGKQNDVCPEDWTSDNQFFTKCYRAFTFITASSYSMSSVKCDVEGGVLPIFDERDRFSQFLNTSSITDEQNPFFVGLTYKNGSFAWEQNNLEEIGVPVLQDRFLPYEFVPEPDASTSGPWCAEVVPAQRKVLLTDCGKRQTTVVCQTTVDYCRSVEHKISLYDQPIKAPKICELTNECKAENKICTPYPPLGTHFCCPKSVEDSLSSKEKRPKLIFAPFNG